MTTLDAYYRQAINAGRDRNYEKAVSLLIKVLSSAEADRYSHALLYLGRSYHALKNYGLAIQILRIYQENNPVSSPANFFLARTYLTVGLHKLARKHLHKVISISPNLLAAHSLLGVSYLRKHETDQALKSFKTALKIDPTNKMTLSGYHNALIFHAINLFFQGKMELAIQYFKESIQEDNNQVIPYLYLSRAYREIGKNSESLLHLEKASILSPNDPSIPVQRALLMSSSGNYKAALKELKNIKTPAGSTLTTGNPEFILRLFIIVLFLNQQYKETLFYGLKFLRNNEGDEDIYFAIAESHRNLGSFQKSLNYLTKASKINSKRLDIRFAKFINYWELKLYHKALTELKAIEKISPEEPSTNYYKILCRHELKEAPEKIIPVLQQQLRKKGSDIPLMTALGIQYLIINLPHLSCNWLNRVLVIKPNHSQSLKSLIKVYESLNDSTRLSETYNTYLRYHTNDKKIRRDYANFLFKNNQWLTAAKEFLELVPHYHNDRKLKIKIARCYLRGRQFSEAIILYRELLKDNIHSDILLEELLECLEKSKKRQYAIALLEKFLQQDPSRYKLHLSLAGFLLRDKQLERAATKLREIIKIAPKSWEPYHYLGLVYKHLGEKKFSNLFFLRAQKLKEKRINS